MYRKQYIFLYLNLLTKKQLIHMTFLSFTRYLFKSFFYKFEFHQPLVRPGTLVIADSGDTQKMLLSCCYLFEYIIIILSAAAKDLLPL